MEKIADRVVKGELYSPDPDAISLLSPYAAKAIARWSGGDLRKVFRAVEETKALGDLPSRIAEIAQKIADEEPQEEKQTASTVDSRYERRGNLLIPKKRVKSPQSTADDIVVIEESKVEPEYSSDDEEYFVGKPGKWRPLRNRNMRKLEIIIRAMLNAYEKEEAKEKRKGKVVDVVDIYRREDILKPTGMKVVDVEKVIAQLISYKEIRDAIGDADDMTYSLSRENYNYLVKLLKRLLSE